MFYKASIYVQLHTGGWGRVADTLVTKLQFSEDLSMGHRKS